MVAGPPPGPALPRLAADARVALRPIALTPADDVAGVSEPLCGGPLRFRDLAVSLRVGETSAVLPGLAAVAEVRAWAAAAPPRAGERILRCLDNLIAPRSPIAGLDFARPRVMGVLNVTPDSFSDGGRFRDRDAAVAHANRLIEAGADIVDVGGESTRPGAAPVSAEEELDRVLPVLESLRGVPAALSIDTRRAAVMEAALGAGAAIINDVSALTYDPASLAVASASGAPIVLMHSLGDPATMQDAPAYDDVLLDIFDYLEGRIAACVAAGIEHARLAVDPGIGFGKTAAHNFEILRGLTIFHGLGCALALGVSRKSFIARASAGEPADQRLGGSLAAAAWGLARGVQILRVHDVAETAQAVRVLDAIASEDDSLKN